MCSFISGEVVFCPDWNAEFVSPMALVMCKDIRCVPDPTVTCCSLNNSPSKTVWFAFIKHLDLIMLMEKMTILFFHCTDTLIWLQCQEMGNNSEITLQLCIFWQREIQDFSDGGAILHKNERNWTTLLAPLLPWIYQSSFSQIRRNWQ